MKIISEQINFDTRGDSDIIDITSGVQEAIERTGLIIGSVIVFVPGATGAVTTIEHEPGLALDLKQALNRWAPYDIGYHHDRKWGDGNGHSHIRASLVGPSLTIPFSDGKLTLGTWQQIIFIDMDNRPRSRKLVVQIMGE